MKKYYIHDVNGKFKSTDGQCRFTLLKGQALYDFFKSDKGRQAKFYTGFDDNGDEIGVEIVDPKIIKEVVQEAKHSDYLREQERESGFTTLPFDALVMPDGDEVSGEEVIADPDVDVEAEVIRRLNIMILRKALKTLTETEMDIITALYLCENPMSERKYAELLGIPQKTLNSRKNAILQKMRKFF